MGNKKKKLKICRGNFFVQFCRYHNDPLQDSTDSQPRPLVHTKVYSICRSLWLELMDNDSSHLKHGGKKTKGPSQTGPIGKLRSIIDVSRSTFHYPTVQNIVLMLSVFRQPSHRSDNLSNNMEPLREFLENNIYLADSPCEIPMCLRFGIELAGAKHMDPNSTVTTIPAMGL